MDVRHVAEKQGTVEIKRLYHVICLVKNRRRKIATRIPFPSSSIFIAASSSSSTAHRRRRHFLRLFRQRCSPSQRRPNLNIHLRIPFPSSSIFIAACCVSKALAAAVTIKHTPKPISIAPLRSLEE
jgi:hypothetical protein